MGEMKRHNSKRAHYLWVSDANKGPAAPGEEQLPAHGLGVGGGEQGEQLQLVLNPCGPTR